MTEKRTHEITTQREAVERLIAWQVEQGGVPTQPAWDDTEWTAEGWAFFNINGYLGTVKLNGDVIEEPGIVEREQAERGE
jgi:hypothetical protein